ncbi:sulfotransferase [Salipiger manganoxidans]|uniref:sulfotransferase n=1 Tax=Salipiger marinus TaxID=555512 RepID=UPI001E4D9DDB|nr:sulfotransferase [Salipiger manganoxidans]MCD1619903.1 sulfotransferase [Salipiger manganoxidans]
MITVATILGLEHSGTTLLARMLGAHSKAFAIGGLKNFTAFAEGRKACSCGETPATCVFWTTVLEEIRSRGNDPQILAAELAAHRRNPALARDAARIIVEAISAASGMSLIVDASRDSTWGALLKQSPSIRVVPIHIFKTPMAQLASAKRKQRSLYAEIGKYISRSRDCRAETSRSSSSVTLAYDELCSAPETSLASIMDAVGLPLEHHQVTGWGAEPLHMIGGNRMRSSTSSKVERDEHWKKLLSGFEVALARLGGGVTFALNERESLRETRSREDV